MPNTPTRVSSGFDTANLVVTPIDMGAVAGSEIIILRILLSVDEEEDITFRDGTTDLFPIFLGARSSGGYDFGDMPLRLTAGNSFNLVKANDANTKLGYYIDFWRL